MEYKTQGTCSTKINFELRDGKVYSVSFENGCKGNLKGIALLVEGMSVEKVISTLRGVKCGSRGTSCPDQLAKALLAATNAGPALHPLKFPRCIGIGVVR